MEYNFFENLGQLDRGTELLLRCLQLAPQHSRACVALGIAYKKLGDLKQAKKFTIARLLPQKHFQAVLDMPAPEQLRALAKNGLRGELPSGGSRLAGCAWTAVFYPAGP